MEAKRVSITAEGNVKARGNWTGKLDFIMSCLSYAVGLGNLWRFPYLCYKNGGGAFLIPYLFMMVFTGMPLFFLELSLGQFCGKGPIDAWQASPLFTGIGYSMFLVSCFVAIYYNMIIAWSFRYTFASFAKDVPWKYCNNDWNTELCSQPEQFKNCTNLNGTWYNQTCWTIEGDGNDTFQHFTHLVDKYGRRSASFEYFHHKVLKLSKGIEEMGLPQWDLALCLLLAWVVIFFCLLKGVKSSGKAGYFTAIFPYLVLIILLGRAVTLEGALKGIKFYITPKWHFLKKPGVWGDAAVQIFFSLGPCWGGLITLASYNKFNNNALRDTILITLLNCGTSIFAGFVIFSILGFMAEQLSLSVDDVAVKGAGLAFVVYPEVVAQLPISPFWSVLFFMMLLTLGVGSQLTIANTVYTVLLDMFSAHLRLGHRPKILLLVVCTTCFILGLTLTCPGGMYMLQLMDNYAATYSALVLGIAECLVISYVYGWQRFSSDIKLMMGRRPTLWWRVLWMAITPGILVFILVFICIKFERASYGGIVLPIWADALGWLISVTCLLPVPAYALYLTFTQYRQSLFQTLRYLSSPSTKWGPSTRATDDKDTGSQSNNSSQELEMIANHTEAEAVPFHIQEPRD